MMRKNNKTGIRWQSSSVSIFNVLISEDTKVASSCVVPSEKNNVYYINYTFALVQIKETNLNENNITTS